MKDARVWVQPEVRPGPVLLGSQPLPRELVLALVLALMPVLEWAVQLANSVRFAMLLGLVVLVAASEVGLPVRLALVAWHGDSVERDGARRP